MRRVETAIAFAGEEWAFLLRFLGAEVMPVSMVAVEGRAVVMVVSRWPISVVVAVLLVSKSARGCVLCAKKFALLGPVRTRARKSSPSVLRKAKNWRFMACWASFFAQMTLEGPLLGEFFRGNAAGGGVPGDFFRATGVAGMPCDYR